MLRGLAIDLWGMSEAAVVASPIVYNDKVDLFSVAFHLITLSKPLLYDLYVNFSADGKSNKFIKVFPAGETMETADLDRIKGKYSRTYILESQRAAYLKSLATSEALPDLEKTAVIKDSAIKYLDELFNEKRTFTTELLNESIAKCHDTVSSMVTVIQNYDIDQLQEHIAKLSFHDFYTYDHSINVSMYCISFYRFLYPKAPESEVVLAGLGGMLHDLGKIKIATSIINNPGKLSDAEFAEMRKHPIFGQELMGSSDVVIPKGMDLVTLKRVISEHHENWDGTGYPNKIKGEDIHIMARVTAICDFFDAITTKRAYSTPMTVSDALDIIGKTSNKKIDGELFKKFCEHVKKAKPKGRSVAEIDSDFDPCMPHAKLPLHGFRHTHK